MNDVNPMATATMRSGRGDPVWEIARLYPLQGDWSEADYLALDTNRLVELSDGCLEILPMPTILHQMIALFLQRCLDDHVVQNGLGRALVAPLPVRLWSGKFREPDVVYLNNERLNDLRGQPDGADLVMEVVSEGHKNRVRDVETKTQEYAAAGIAEYWIIDPQNQAINVLTLDGGKYVTHGEFTTGDTASGVLLPEFRVAVASVFAPAQTSE